MGIDIYINNQIIKKWFLQSIGEIGMSNDLIVHNSLETLYSTLLTTKKKRIVIIDTEDRASIEYFNSIYLAYSNINIIAIGSSKPIVEIIQLISLGFKGFVDLSFSTAEVLQIIYKVNNGSKYLSSIQQENLLNHLTLNFDNSSLVNHKILSSTKQTTKTLTEKEKRVFELLITGISYKEIANAIGVSSFTINQRVKGIYKKMDVRSRGELSFRYLS